MFATHLHNIHNNTILLYRNQPVQTTPHTQLSLEFSELQSPSDVIFSCESNKVQLSSTKTHAGRSASHIYAHCGCLWMLRYRKKWKCPYLRGSESTTGREPTWKRKRKGKRVSLINLTQVSLAQVLISLSARPEPETFMFTRDGLIDWPWRGCSQWA